MNRKINVLLVEDDLNLGFVIKDNLKQESFNVDWRTKGDEGLKSAISGDYDIALFDVMLPVVSGFEIAEELKELNLKLPIIFLTAKSMVNDKVKGLKLADDYLCKPFDFKELIQRMKNVLDSNKTLSTNVKSIFKVGNYKFDYVNQQLVINKDTQKLTKKECDLLRLLCRNKNEVMSRELALKSIWGNDDYFNGRSMDVFISKIRKYLSQDESVQIINVHGVGFKLAVKKL